MKGGRTNVFIVRWEDLNQFQSLLYDLPDIPPEIRRFDGRSKSDWWDAPPVYSDAPKLDEPDFWHLVGSSTIVVKPELAEELAGFFHPVGEFLRLRMSGTNECLLALNILRDVDCLNPNAYRLDDLEIYTDFLAHRLGESGLFKIPQADETAIFYLEREDETDSLRNVIEARELRGLRFDPVWSTSGRIEPINLLAV